MTRFESQPLSKRHNRKAFRCGSDSPPQGRTCTRRRLTLASRDEAAGDPALADSGSAERMCELNSTRTARRAKPREAGEELTPGNVQRNGREGEDGHREAAESVVIHHSVPMR